MDCIYFRYCTGYIITVYFSFFLLDRCMCLHSVLIVGWWSSNPRTEVIRALEYFPLVCLMRYVISYILRSCPLPTTDPPLFIPSPLTHPLSPPPPSLRQLGIVPPDPIICYKPILPAYVPSPHRGPKSSTLRCTV